MRWSDRRGGEGREDAAAVDKPLRQTHEKQGLGVLGEELCLLAERLRPAAVVCAGSDQADAENGLIGGHFVSVVRETREGLQYFRFGVRDVEHGHGHWHDAAERRVAELKGDDSIH